MPQAVRLFEILMFISVALAIGATVYLFQTVGAFMDSGDRTTFIGFIAFGVLLTMALTLWASRGRSAVARNILLVLLAIALLQFAREIGTLFSDGVVFAAIQVIQLVLQGIGLGLLFTPEAKAYLERKSDVAAA